MSRYKTLFVGLVVGIGISFVAVLAQAPPCASAAAVCPVGSTSTFSGNIGIQSNTAYTTTLEAASSTANRLITFPDADDRVAVLDATQTFTNKTLTSPAINSATITGGTISGATISSSTHVSPVIQTSIVLDQTTADYTITWADPSAPRAYSIIDSGQSSSDFVMHNATQSLTNKTINFSLNTGSNYDAGNLIGATLNALVTSSSLDTVGTITTGVWNAGAVTSSGFITADSSSSADYVRFYGGSGTGKWDIYGSGANLRFSDNESLGLVDIDTDLTVDGDVGIGTGVNPINAPLHVYRATIDTLAEFESGDTITQVKISDSASDASYPPALKVTANTVQLLGGSYAGQQASYLAVNGLGNVGIGIATPQKTLHVKNTSGVAQLRLDYNGAYSEMFFNADMYFQPSGTTKMTIKADGNVGIGVSAPLAKLHIEGVDNTLDSSLYLRNKTADIGDYNGIWFSVENDTADQRFKQGIIAQRSATYGRGSFHLVNDLGADNNNAEVGDAFLTHASDGILYLKPTGDYLSIGDGGTAKKTIALQDYSGDAVDSIKSTYWGYSTTYEVTQIGATGSNTLSFGYDPSSNAWGGFTGDGSEMLFRNGQAFLAPNSGDTSFYRYITMKDGYLGIKNASTPVAVLDVLVGNSTSFDATWGLRLANNADASGTYAGIGYALRSASNAKAWSGFVYSSGYGRGDYVILLDNASDDNSVVMADEVMRITHEGDLFLGSGTYVKLTPSGTFLANGSPLTLSRSGAGSMTINNDITFAPYNTTDAMIIEQTTGHVGIGTASPTSHLGIGADRSVWRSIQFLDEDNSGAIQAYIASYNTNTTDGILRLNAIDELQLRVGDVDAVLIGVSTEKNVRLPNGSLIVGEDISATCWLCAKEDGSGGKNLLKLQHDAGNEAWITMTTDSSTAYWGWGDTGGAGDLYIRPHNSTAKAMILDDQGVLELNMTQYANCATCAPILVLDHDPGNNNGWTNIRFDVTDFAPANNDWYISAFGYNSGGNVYPRIGFALDDGYVKWAVDADGDVIYTDTGASTQFMTITPESGDVVVMPSKFVQPNSSYDPYFAEVYYEITCAGSYGDPACDFELIFTRSANAVTIAVDIERTGTYPNDVWSHWRCRVATSSGGGSIYNQFCSNNYASVANPLFTTTGGTGDVILHCDECLAASGQNFGVIRIMTHRGAGSLPSDMEIKVYAD